MFPLTDEFFLCDRSLWHSTITLRHHDRPTGVSPTNGTHTTEHYSVAIGIAIIVGRESLLRRIIPVAIAILEYGAVTDTHPTIITTKLIRMSDYRECITTLIGDIHSIHTLIWAIDIL